MKNIVMILVSITALGALVGCTDLTPAPQHEGVAKSRWMRALPSAMSEELCSSNSTLRKCYPVSDEECHRRVESATVGCEQDYSTQIPAELLPADTENWGSTIGQCTNAGLFQAVEARSEECQRVISTM